MHIFRGRLIEQARLTGQHHLVGLVLGINGGARQLQCCLKIRIDSRARFGHFANDSAFHLREITAGVAHIDQIRSSLELFFRHRTFDLNNPVLNLALINDEDDQHAVARQR